MTLLTAVFIIIFSTLGLGIVHLSHIYMRLAAYKKTSVRLDYSAENGLKQAFSHFMGMLETAPAPLRLTETDYAELKSDTQNNGLAIPTALFGSGPPYQDTGEMGTQSWITRIDLEMNRCLTFESYFSVTYGVNIRSDGKVMNFRAQRKALAGAEMKLRAGRVPLSLIPVVVGRNLDHKEAQDYLAEHGILTENPSVGPTDLPVASGEELLPLDAQGLVQKALNIDIFRPQDLTPGRLRTAIGLEPGTEPVPEGVYLIQDDLGLGGVYVKGDLTSMILAIENEYQIIAFRQEQRTWILKYNPKAPHTIFLSPEKEQAFDLVPRGIIIVDGKIENLGGGTVSLTGELVLQTDRELACLLKGIDLTIVCSDRITLSAHLIHEGVTWQDGIPYIKDCESQLHILATGTTALGMDEGAGEIVIDSSSSDELKLQADLTALRDGITVKGDDKTVDVLGSLHFPEFEANGNSIILHPDTRFQENEGLLQNAPATSHPILLFSELRVVLWETRTQ